MGGEAEEGEVLLTWYLEGVLQDGKRWIIPLDPLPFSVGRMNTCNLVLSSKSVSRAHADLFLRGSGLWVRDLGSRNGTYLNRKRVRGPVAVGAGDVLHFGTVEFRIGRREESGAMDETTTGLNRVSDLSNLFKSFEGDLKTLIERRAALSLFQPIIHLDGRTLFGYEVTARGTFEGLPTGPEELFSIASGVGAEADLSRLFWTEGIRTGARLPGDPVLFINLHPAEISEPTLIPALAALREELPETLVVAEVSEKAVTNLPRMSRLRAELVGLGIRLAYDDFGAGQTRLLELVEVPPHFLKFDQGLVRDIHQRPRRLFQVVKALVTMAEELGIACIAEGVESASEGEACAHAGFQFAQGFFYGRPAQLGLPGD
jgi:EAL domain-containing protein (putative c-di-GMP-specific phosphodiesterase class I)